MFYLKYQFYIFFCINHILQSIITLLTTLLPEFYDKINAMNKKPKGLSNITR